MLYFIGNKDEHSLCSMTFKIVYLVYPVVGTGERANNSTTTSQANKLD